MGDSIGGLGRRAIQLGQSVQYALLTVSAVRILLGARGGRGPKRAAAGILGWPGGTVIVAALGVAVAIVAVVNVYWGVSKRLLESLDRRELTSTSRRVLALVGTVGFVALGFVLGVVAWFMVKAAVDYNAGDVVSLGGAMSHLARAVYANWLLTAVAAGLISYGVFGLLQARYHRV